MSLLYKKKNFKILLISGIFIILGFFIIFNHSQILKWWEVNFEGAEAGTSDNVRGWAWGENMGWISMNCYNDFTSICSGGSNNGESCNSDDDCPDGTCVKDGTFENCCLGGTDCPTGLEGHSYGVTYVDATSGNYIDDALMGYAWSDKVGWICFGKSCKCADCRICSDGSGNAGALCENNDDCVGGICGCIDHITCTGCPEECSNVKPPHGWPFPWACVGRPTWVCGNDDNQICSNDDQCGGENDFCVFSCSGDGGEDFLDISTLDTPCYSANRATLRAHWEMNSPTGDIAEALVDSSIYGNTLSGDNLPILANGKFDDALQFDGEDDYIQAYDSESLSVSMVCFGGDNDNELCLSNDDCPDGACINKNLTVEAWIKRGTIGSEQTIIGKWDEAVEGKSYRLWFDTDNKLNFSVANDNVDAIIAQLEGICFGYENDGTASCPSDAYCVTNYGEGTFCRNPLIIDTTKWHHIAGKYITSPNAPSLQLFIDGLKVNTEFPGTTPASLSDKDNKLYIGAKMGNSGMDTYFNGIIDNVAIWSCGGTASFVSGRSAKDIWADAKMEISGWAKVVSLGDGGWLKLQGFTKTGKVWGLYLDDYDTFYTIGGYMANRYADTSMDTTGLVANWLMDEPSWSNAAGQISNGVIDSSPLVNHGTAVNGATPSTEGIFNSAGEFDGNDYIQVPDSDSLDFTAEESFTIQFWVKPNSFANSSTIVGKRQVGGLGYEIGITSAGYISWHISDEVYGTGDTDALTVNAWNHVAIVFDRGHGISRYLNGVFMGNVDSFGGLGDLSNTLSLSIGKNSGGTYFFNGLIDNVSIYNIAKTATQISADYNKQNPYCVGWDDYGHHYGDPPDPFDFEITSINNTDGGCYQLLVHWDISTWAESYTYWRCNNVLEAQCDDCPAPGYIERNVLGGACDIQTGKCSLQDEGLSENTGYCYKIQAHNETSSTYNSNGPVWKSTTLCSPGAPTINDDTCGEIKLTWGWDPTGSSDGYNIYNSLNTSSNFGIISHIGEGMDYTGLVAQWKMNETSWDGSNKEVRDSSNQTPANHGTAQNLLTTTSDGKFSYAGNFDGNGDYITVQSKAGIEITGAITVEAWIKPTLGTMSYDARIVSKGHTSFETPYAMYELNLNSGLPRFRVSVSDSPYEADSTGLITFDEWHHLAGTYDGVDIKIYVDGTLKDTTRVIGNIDTNSEQLVIGRHLQSEGMFFDGLIDNVVIYNVARTAEQIKFDYEAGNCGYDDCSLSGECHLEGLDTNCGYALDDPDNCQGCGCHIQGEDTNCGYELDDPDSCQGCYVCHVLNNDDRNCGKTQEDAGDPSICCYTDKRILPYVNYYYKTTATSEAGESPFSDCNWGEPAQPECPSGFEGSCCPWGNTICFPPVETEEE